MKKDRYLFTNNHTEGWSSFSMVLTDSEAEIVCKIINGLNKNRTSKYAPHLTMVNQSLNERETERRLKEEEAIAEEKRIEEIRLNGPMAKAFERAMEKKREKENQ